ncbi:MAG: ZPR1 zinc finger domain-containing protein [Theionarchaea archaeon]|nr:ZPR1 zinc finger domain-containing protein [Theionarchaea archaeon]MBU6999215.1 ZPR1 zinc finger domain-containing protein [Theionarchaea archaeon]MBU7019660.1 ZPR1 zinc finger domain-containing protein [Theionarchaea archaeon]MBU7034581.1 ZPR1 zinc finger domain-containing protein [Theionarchaea archaeon]MBU7040981.1 ZPR1 zinc finger domain-containing protein [Theionarchaea archaeon]
MECPSCGGALTLITETYEIPYFGMVLQSTFICSCGYRFVDIFPFEEKIPMRYTLPVGRDALCVRVVKSSTCVIEIPELGVRVEPGPASEGIVTNIEGILRRVESALKTAIQWGDPDQKRKGKKILKNLWDVLEGNGVVTVILEDPRGFSCIVSEKAVADTL